MIFAALLAAVWLTGAEGPSAVVDSPNLVGRVVASRFDGTNDYTTVYFTHDLDRAPSAAVCYVAKGATNAVYGLWQGGWTNKVAIGGIQGDVYEGVEYLENEKNNINCVIFTGMSPSSDVGIRLISDIIGYDGDKGNLAGSTTASLFAGGKSIAIYVSSNSSLLAPYGNSKTYAMTPSLSLGVEATFSLNFRNDGMVKVYQSSGYICNAAISTTYSSYGTEIALFALPTSSNTFYSGCAKQRARRCEISTGGEYARYFLPVLHDGEGKMLDIVHNTLYANAGTGAFTVGPSKGRIIVPTGGWGQDVPEDPYQTAEWTNCRVLVTRRPAALRNAEARPDLRFSFGNAETRTPFAVKGLALTVNSNAVEIVDGILTKKGL